MQRYSLINYTHTQILSGKETFQEYIHWKMGDDSYEVLHMKNNNHASGK